VPRVERQLHVKWVAFAPYNAMHVAYPKSGAKIDESPTAAEIRHARYRDTQNRIPRLKTFLNLCVAMLTDAS
jgi:hypothetical protein